MTQLHTYAEARLGRWVLWCNWGARPGPKTVMALSGVVLKDSVERNGHISLPCPVDIEEAEDTHRAWMVLDPELREAVHQAYIRGGTVEQQMRSLGIKSRRTYYKHLERAYVQLIGFLNDLAAGVPLPKPRAREAVAFMARPRVAVSASACGVVARLRSA